MSFLSQVTLLLWKNLQLQKTKKCVAFFGLVLPLMFASILMYMRELLGKPLDYPAAVFDPTCFRDGQGMTENPPYLGIRVAYKPVSPFTKKLMETVRFQLRRVGWEVSIFKGDSRRGWEVGLIFKDVDCESSATPPNLTYYMRIRSGDWYRTEPLNPNKFRPGVPNRVLAGSEYIDEGMTQLQMAIGAELIRRWSKSQIDLDLCTNKFPGPAYSHDVSIVILGTCLPWFFLFSFTLSVFEVTKTVVYEKERKIKESMKLMGMQTSAYWVSWFLTFFIYLVFVMGIYVFMLVTPGSHGVPVLMDTDISLFFLFVLCYICAILSYGIMMSVFFQTANAAAGASGTLFFMLFLPYLYYGESTDYATKIHASFSFNAALGFGSKAIANKYVLGKGGVTWENYHEPTYPDVISLADCMKMMLVDTVIHLVITWYVDAIYPGDFGVPQPYFFFLSKEYWCGTKAHPPDEEVMQTADKRFLEAEPVDLHAGIRICNLRKAFGGGKVAVHNLTLNMYEGHITVLLGHNGAGKSTTMFMLTGFYPPTSGTAYVNDLDIRNQITEVRASLGLCPQHDVLFDTLTVEQHLYFFGKLKGLYGDELKEQVEEMIKETGLEAKRFNMSKTLSGGQKRRLSVGIAIIGGSKVVILDEPTAGVDPSSRRQMWTLLQRHREGRTLILSTHFMDEADALGNRIAIMADGGLVCCGSPMFLKDAYGTGYRLVVVKAIGCKRLAVTAAIQKMIPAAKFSKEVASEIFYLLPDDKIASFPALFRSLESKKKTLKILSFGATATTLEDVFLKVGQSLAAGGTKADTIPDTEATDEYSSGEQLLEGLDAGRRVRNESGVDEVAIEMENTEEESEETEEKDGDKNQNNPEKKEFAADLPEYTKLEGVALLGSQIQSILNKRLIHTVRSPLWTAGCILLPVIFAAMALRLARFERHERAKKIRLQEGIPADLRNFPHSMVAYLEKNCSTQEDNEMIRNLTKHYRRLFSRRTTVKRMVLQGNETHLAQRLSKVIKVNNLDYIVGAEFGCPSPGRLGATAFYNSFLSRGEPIGLSYVLNGVARSVGKIHSIKTIILEPFKEAKSTSLFGLDREHSPGLSVAMNFPLGMAFLVPLFVHFLIFERIVGAKHLQIVSGVSPTVFWLATLLWDMFLYMVCTFLILAVFVMYDIPAYTHGGRVWTLLLLLALHGWAMLGVVYFGQKIFLSPPAGMTAFILYTIFSGVVVAFVIFVGKLISVTTADTKAFPLWIKVLDVVLKLISSNYCLTQSIMNMGDNWARNADCDRFDFNCTFLNGACCGDCSDLICLMNAANDDYMGWREPGIGQFLVGLLVQGAVGILLTLINESDMARSWGSEGAVSTPTDGKAEEGEDSDVAAERHRINNSPVSVLAQEDSLLLVNLHKQFGSFQAVKRVCVGVSDKECFGLLGQNGAGKSTIFKMLTGDTPVTDGNAYLKTYDIKSNMKLVQRNMGYCPQFDALLGQMTARETLIMYARLRGVPDEHLEEVVSHLIKVMTLMPFTNKQCGTYSGGNKRKLSTAVALVGNPHFVLLDEPSSGMDAGAMRAMWDVLSQVRESGKTLVFTSHSMEEAEALCTIIAIMVTGRFVCLGSAQHLKIKFGQGYTVIVKMKRDEEGTPLSPESVISFIQHKYPQASVFEEHDGYVHLQVPGSDVQLADLFELLWELKREMPVQDYAIHQTSLEQVLLSFTRHQPPPASTETGKGRCCIIC